MKYQIHSNPAYWDWGYHGATVYVFNGDILWESLGYKQPISYNHKMAGQKLGVSKFHLKMQGVHSGEWPHKHGPIHRAIHGTALLHLHQGTLTRRCPSIGFQGDVDQERQACFGIQLKILLEKKKNASCRRQLGPKNNWKLSL
jgi:hypothetical protein